MQTKCLLCWNCLCKGWYVGLYAGSSDHPDTLICKRKCNSFSCKLQQLATAVVYLYSCEIQEGFYSKEGYFEPDMIPDALQ